MTMTPNFPFAACRDCDRWTWTETPTDAEQAAADHEAQHPDHDAYAGETTPRDPPSELDP